MREKRPFIRLWDQYVSSAPEDAMKFGSAPRFESDERFLPLQGADLWAGAVRLWTESGTPEKANTSDFGKWAAKRTDRRIVTMRADKSDMEKYLLEVAEKRFPGRVTLGGAWA
jgi:hypothetical protein